jgi:hypothetical protein
VENPTSIKIAGDLRQSEEYGQFMEKIGWKTVQVPNPKSQVTSQIFVKKLGPVSIAKLQRAEQPLPWNEIEKILKKEKVMMCIIEPCDGNQNEFIKHGYRVNKEPLLGTKTLRIDLRPDEEKILKSFKKDARYILKKFTIYNFQFSINDYKKFYEIWQQSAKRKHLWIPKEDEYSALITAFGKNVFGITIGNEAGAIILIYKKTAFYYYAGGTSEGTKKNLPYPVVWTAMKEAKKRGCLVWDFEGIYNSKWPNKTWLGFSHFKKSFGGAETEYPGSFIKWRWPF